ncbi:MAG: DNA primase [Candidatus Melainabacteria bacterium]|nr:DNA primase [Candidatus Melainabacteria bacterium]
MANVLSFAEAADAVKQNLDIVEVVGREVALKKRGRTYLGLCPFHKEKTPSFNVNREKNLFKCFGCGEAGDALAFLMKRGHRSYGEIIQELAQEQGIVIEDKSSQEAKQAAVERQDLHQKICHLNQLALSWFQQCLNQPEGQPVQDYLAQRGTTREAIERFKLGFAKPGWDQLIQHLGQTTDYLRQQPDILITAGLASPRNNPTGSLLSQVSGGYDRFRNRLMIPILDEKGQVVAFGGRALSPEDTPKYLNSPETAVYIKSRILYGLCHGKEAIRQSKLAVVMEGYFDVISAHMAGIPEAVATCGTALTEQHLKLLVRHGVETVYLAFDADNAGLNAAGSAIAKIEPLLSVFPVRIKVLLVPDGKDPDDFIRRHGGEAFRALFATAKEALDFKLDAALRGLSLQGPEDRIEAAQRLTPLLAAITQPVARSTYLAQYAQRIGVSEEALHLEVRRYQKSSPAKSPLQAAHSVGATAWAQSERGFEGNRKQFDAFSSGHAISRNPSSSYKGQRQRHTSPDNFQEMRRSLQPRALRAENNLMALFFVDDVSPQRMLSLVDTDLCRVPDLLQDPINLRLYQVLRQALGANVLFKPAHASQLQQTVQAQFNPNDPDLPVLLQRLSSAVFDGDQLRQKLNQENVTSEALLSGAEKSAQQCLYVLQQQHRQRQLAALNNTLRQQEQQRAVFPDAHPSASPPVMPPEEDTEFSLLEIQYQLREQLQQAPQPELSALDAQNHNHRPAGSDFSLTPLTVAESTETLPMVPQRMASVVNNSLSVDPYRGGTE